MFRIFKNTRKNFLKDNKFSKYVLYAVGEIVLIVVGILMALQINNWNTARVEKRNEIKSYQNIMRQIEDDMNELTRVKELNQYYADQYDYGMKIIIQKNYNKTDTLSLIAMQLSQYSDFHRSNNIYENLVNSGDIVILKNFEIISKLQKLEMTYISLNKLEDIHWETIINELSPELRGVINYTTLETVKPEKLYSVEIQNFLFESIYLTKFKDSIYGQAIDEIRTIIDLITEELNTGRKTSKLQ